MGFKTLSMKHSEVGQVIKTNMCFITNIVNSIIRIIYFFKRFIFRINKT